MWKDYSWNYIKKNRASSSSIIAAAFISALFLSLLCSLFFNIWKYDVERIQREEGGWHGRLTGEIEEEALAVIQNFANVRTAVINRELSDGPETVVDIRFENMRTAVGDMALIAEAAGLGPESASCHHSLLAMYLVRDPKDPAPRLVFPFFLGVTALACLSLILIIHNSFAVSMNARIHQFGILSSIGATPGQIRSCLMQEAAVLCAAPILLGNLAGILLGRILLSLIDTMAGSLETGRVEAVWGYHPLAFVFTFAISAFTVLASAWLPARKLSRLTPLAAIRTPGDFQLKRRRNSRILFLLFGIEGELAGNALKAQKKALRTTTFSLTFAFLAFTLMQCFFALSAISTEMTYFEKYQNAWDAMVTVKNTEINHFQDTSQLQELSGVRDCTVYQKAAAKRWITLEETSEEFRALGGFQNAPAYEGNMAELLSNGPDSGAADAPPPEDARLVNAPIIILDDASFLRYCEQIGAGQRLDGAVILNRARDSGDPNFRSRNYFPYLRENQSTTVLRQAGHEDISAEIPVLSYTRTVPLLRESYGDTDYFELVHFLPSSLWETVKTRIGGAGADSYIRILAGEDVTPEEMSRLEQDITQLVHRIYGIDRSKIESENRIRDKISNDNMVKGMMFILGFFCILLAAIGIVNVFTNTLGFLHQRKREFARYMSIGLTPGGMKKIFCLEALILAGRPILTTLPPAVLAVALMLKASFLAPSVFLKEAPVLPILTFILAIYGFIALAYYLGGRKILRASLTDALSDDTLL